MITCPKCAGSGKIGPDLYPILCYICVGRGEVEEPPSACEACDYPAKLTIYGGNALQPIRRYWLCDLCAGTYTANTIIYPNQHTDDQRILKTLCFVGNAIIAAILRCDNQLPVRTQAQGDTRCILARGHAEAHTNGTISWGTL